MMQDEYYVVERENNDEFPIFTWDSETDNLFVGKPVDIGEPLLLTIMEPVPPAYKLVDYHESPDPIVSDRFKNAIESKVKYGTQFIPVHLALPDKSNSSDNKYWLMHVFNWISCLDQDESEVTYSSSGNTIFDIEKLSLDRNILSQIDIEKRLLFVLAECSSIYIIHKSIRKILDSHDLLGFRFFKVSEWYSDISFA